MPENPVFSIITVTRNNLHGLQRTHHSLRIQSFTNFEWIVVDGASADGTKDYLAHTGAHWTSEPDNGIYDAMNKGLEPARGEYILFLNAGDSLADASTLARLGHFIKAQKKKPDFIYGDSLENGFYKPARNHAQHMKGMFTHHQSMIYLREMIRDMRYDKRYKIAADYDFTVRTIKKEKDILYFPFPVCIFETGGVSQINAAQGRREQFLIRHRLRTANLLTNSLIYLLQAGAWTLRQRAPGFYWRVKSSGNKPPGLART